MKQFRIKDISLILWPGELPRIYVGRVDGDGCAIVSKRGYYYYASASSMKRIARIVNGLPANVYHNGAIAVMKHYE